MEITLIGAGNLATNLGKALLDAGHRIQQVYSRTEASASALASYLGTTHTTHLEQLSNKADLYIISVSDDALANVARLLPETITAPVVHTAGSIDMDVLPQRRRGVFYPMQTFSKQRQVDFTQLTTFIEAANEDDLALLRRLAERLGSRCISCSSKQRRSVHLAAVFACNFTNRCYDMAAEVLEANGIPFSVLLLLTDETARKVHTLLPREAQTGPAVRRDTTVTESHLRLLQDLCPHLTPLYEALTESIKQRHDD